MAKKRVLIPLPAYGFDPTESGIPWQLLTSLDREVMFATPHGLKAQADQRMITGNGLGIWTRLLKAREDAVVAYREMEKCDAFNKPLKYSDIIEKDFDGLLLPGGHDKGMRAYLESELLQQIVVEFFLNKKPVAAICHGVVLVARSIDPRTRKSVIYDYQTTALLKSQESTAYQFTRLFLKDYYLTYPGQMVESEVKFALSDQRNFQKGPTPYGRDDLKHLHRGFTVRDRNYLSARWPGDAYKFSLEFGNMMK